MSKTLVIVLSETRAHELTFDNIKKNLIDEVNADLCVCIGVKPDYDYENPFYKLAKYRFTYDEPEDFGDAFDYAYNTMLVNRPEFEYINEENKTPLNWREFLKIKGQFWGGVKDETNQHEGSAGILIFFRWFLLKNLIENDVIDKYDRFIITRSDFMYQLPHPKVELMDENYIWVPDCEHYGGFTDRHTVLTKTTIIPYLSIFNNFVLKSNEFFTKMVNKTDWNLEQVIQFNLEQNNISQIVKQYPYIMYSVRNVNGVSRWAQGNFSDELGYYIKYKSEYDRSSHYKDEFEKSGSATTDEYYRNKFSV